MKIALLGFGKTWGGTEVHSVKLADALTKRGHTVYLVCLTDSTYDVYRERAPSNSKLIHLPTPKPWPKMSFANWRHLFSAQNWNVCVVNKGEFGVGGWRMDLAARLRFKRYITIEHLAAEPMPPKTSYRRFGLIPGIGLWWYQMRFGRWFRSTGPCKIVCVSDGVRRNLMNECRFSPQKLITICNGIDGKQFRPDRSQGIAWRERWRIPPAAIVFGAIARFAEIKGLDTAISGYKAVTQRFPGKATRLVFVGEGPEEGRLRALAQDVLPPGHVTFAPFSLHPWEPLNAIDVFLLPSINEGLPLSLVEAMACGRCVVATAVGGVPEVVTGPELGWLVPPGDTKAFADAMIEACLRSDQERAEIGDRGRQHVLRCFNGDIQFNRLADVIES